MTIPNTISELVDRFQNNIDAYKSGRYNETQVRQEFINPLFEALGWDIYNRQGYAESYKDVVHEDAIKIGKAVKAPDYCFRIGGTRKFFLEAKKPSTNIKEDVHPAYQLRRYAWSAKLPLSILTDFEEFAVYDCRIKPIINDKPSVARIFYLNFKEYIPRWQEIVSIYSREAILKGSFDKYVESNKAKHGTAEVDTAFLQEIERWREAFARNIALRNPGLNYRELNFAVQTIIDRIIFLRISEDRGIEPYGRLMALQNDSDIYSRLCQLFRLADDRYNSGLFHFNEEKGRPESPDELTLNLSIDDKVLKDVFKNLYYPDSPYEFSVLPADILGQVYERFLGKVIRLTPSHRAIIEDKPEVKKAGGVYYTPTHIVDYIVKHTVAIWLQNKTVSQVDNLRIIDPACGSGSFLIEAYQCLLDWHRAQYLNDDPQKWAKGSVPRIQQGEHGDWRLTTKERKRILLNNIYGVDIDPQAVEVTKLSLLLKVLELDYRQLSLLQEPRVLPDLGRNIKCGNSLISQDYYNNKQFNFLDDEEHYRINAFNWATEFPNIFKQGGFDVVIGNPPYVFGRDWSALNITNDVKEYLGEKYKSSPFQLDMFSIFMEKAFQLGRDKGYIGQIVPNVWLTNMFSSRTREFVLRQSNGLCILATSSKVFPELTVDTVVYTLQKTNIAGKLFRIREIGKDQIVDIAEYDTEQYINGNRPISTVLNRESANLVFRLRDQYQQLRSMAKITRGVHSYRTGGYGQTAFGTGPQTSRDINERPYHSQTEKTGYRPFIHGRDLQLFSPPIPMEFVKYGPWLAEPRQPEFFEGERVYSRKILGERLIVTVESTNSVADQQVYITVPNPNTVSAAYLAGLLGSRLIAFFIRHYYDEVRDAFPQIKVGQLKELPIPQTDYNNSKYMDLHNELENLVQRLLDLHKQLYRTNIAHDKTELKRQVESIENQIDEVTYRIYSLSDDEINIIKSQA